LSLGSRCTPEERSTVIASFSLLHKVLVGEEGRALAEEHPEGPSGDIGHGVLTVLARTQIGKGRDGAPKKA
jgi:hypothetical protein